MSAGWEVGDLALCIRDPFGDTEVLWEPVVGGIYTVADVDWRGLLDFEEDPDKFDPDAAWEAVCFVKVTPPAADEFDRETIELMNRAPTKEPVA